MIDKEIPGQLQKLSQKLWGLSSIQYYFSNIIIVTKLTPPKIAYKLFVTWIS
jgi:hypothetical protein